MARAKHFFYALTILLFFAGAARAQLYGVATEEDLKSADTNTKVVVLIGESTLYSIDPDSGAATPIGPTGFAFCTGLDFHPITNVLYAVCFDAGDNQVLITIDPLTGAGTEVAMLSVEGPIQDISFRGDGTLFAYYISKPGNFLTTIDIDTGAVHFVGYSGLFGGGNGIGFGQSNDLFLADTDFVPSIPSLYLLNQSTGVASLITDLTLPPLDEGVPLINSLDLNPETGVMFGSLDNQAFSYENYLVTINTTTGEVTNIGETVDGLEAIAFLNPPFVSAIPTLSEVGMVVMGLVLLSGSLFVLIRRRRVTTV